MSYQKPIYTISKNMSSFTYHFIILYIFFLCFKSVKSIKTKHPTSVVLTIIWPPKRITKDTKVTPYIAVFTSCQSDHYKLLVHLETWQDHEGLHNDIGLLTLKPVFVSPFSSSDHK